MQVIYFFDLTYLALSSKEPKLLKVDNNQVRLTCGIGSGSRYSAANDYREAFRGNESDGEYFGC